MLQSPILQIFCKYFCKYFANILSYDMRSEPHRIEGSHSCVLQHRNIPELSKHGNYSPGLGGFPGACASCASQAPVDSQQFTHGQTCRHGLVGHKDSVLSSPASVEPQASQDAQVMPRTSLKQTCSRQSTTMACLTASPPASPPPPSSQLPAPSSQLPAPSSQLPAVTFCFRWNLCAARSKSFYI